MPDEVWQPIPGWPGYEASNRGRVRSLDRRIKMSNGRTRIHWGRIKRTYRNATNGYVCVGLFDGPRHATPPLHVVVCSAFHGPKPSPQAVVRHLNGDRDDNRPDNLAWGTQSENNFDLVRHGTHWQSAKTHCAHGHPFNEANTYWRPEGGRRCRACKRIRQRKPSHG
ncbi:NUMOD4 motif-containing HNH endonuclease [Mycolicibacterium peregrinum]|uniref:NUMOD4 motif-containing HNH endonuclease n=1 Tax=Mycolicibacterium peregrinum TaxID=43304 RepID=UPI003AABEE4A